MLNAGEQLGNYRIVRLLGQGGFANVYLGEHIHLGTQAAIKVLQAQLTNQDIQQFRDEARTIAHLKHPHIVQVLDFGVDGNTPFLVMEYAADGTLRKRHPVGSIVPLKIILSYVKQVAAALQHAHDQKLIHQDVKPENMLVKTGYDILLSDFGIAVIAHNTSSQQTPTSIGGTWAYMAPERFRGKPHPASDQYSLGVVVYEWLCGNCPFQGDIHILPFQHMSVPPPPFEKHLQIPASIEDIVQRALAKDLNQRFASVQEFAEALEQAVTHITPHPVPIVPPHVPQAPVTSGAPAAPTVQQSQPSTQGGRTPEEERKRVLALVKEYWIQGVLDHSLHREAIRKLMSYHQVSAGTLPRNLALQLPNGSLSQPSLHTRIIQIYDVADGELLITGKSGTGKTTLLLKLARDLIVRAEGNTDSFPVVFSLVSWAIKPQSIKDWLIDELCASYQVSRELAEWWIGAYKVHPLFDELDEVPEEKRPACVEALADYWRNHPVPMVLCCQEETRMLIRQWNLPFKRVIVVQPLTAQQIDDYLNMAATPLRPLQETLSTDAALQKLATTPLMLSLLILMYHQSKSTRDLRDMLIVTPETRQQTPQDRIYFLYARKMLQTSAPDPHSFQQSLQGLIWLARLMKKQSLSFFSFEQVKQVWLLDDRLRGKYYGYFLLLGLLLGLLCGLPFGLLLGLPFGLLCGLLPVLLGGLIGVSSENCNPEVLSGVLRYSGYTPKKNYRDFLDDATRGHLLHKVGKNYRFVHPLLLDYFASLDETSLQRMTGQGQKTP